MEYRISYIVLATLVGFIIPIYSMLSGGKKANEFLLESPELKSSIYIQSIIFQWIVTALIFLSLFYNGDSLNKIGLNFLTQPIWILGLFAISLFGLWVFNNIDIPKINLEKFEKRYKDVKYLIPTTQKEYGWSIVLSYTAGICEEIIFRGFTFWQLNQFIPVVPSILIVNLLFALSHFATKIKNMVFAFFFGVVWSIIFLWTGSLWLAMLIHIIVDFYSITRGKKASAKLSKNTST